MKKLKDNFGLLAMKITLGDLLYVVPSGAGEDLIGLTELDPTLRARNLYTIALLLPP